jgi:3-hydroxy-D-aspartate aldolase
MNMVKRIPELEVGYNVPAAVGMDEKDIQTPALVLDLDALERNIEKMGRFAKEMGVRHRVHGKMHKSVDVALLQHELGGACGVCCQKVSEAEAFARGGIKDVLVSNQVRDPAKIDRLARIPLLGARAICCVDDPENIPDLSAAARKHGTTIECLVEIDCGAGRCGVTTTEAVVEIATAIDAAEGLKFARHTGLSRRDAAHGQLYEDRKAKIDVAVAHGQRRRGRAEGRHGVGLVTSLAAAAPGLTISKAPAASITSFSAGPTPSWTPIMAASSTRTASASTKANGKTRCSS